MVVTDDFKFLIRIERIRDSKNLTPWLRRKKSLSIQLPLRVTQSAERILKHADCLEIIRAARAHRKHTPVEVRLHPMDDTLIAHVEHAGRVASQIVGLNSELVNLLHRLRRKYRTLRITLFGRDLLLLKTVMGAIPEAAISFETEGLYDLRKPERPLRSVLVFTNVSGPHLDQLGTNLSFWSKGIPGFRFRHIFGNLNRKRVESALLSKEWDMVIYRGHANLISGRIHWQLADGAWLLPVTMCTVYVHSACLADAQSLDLAFIPAQTILTPLRYLPDFEDGQLVRLFLERYRTSRAINSAAQAVQAEFPQFSVIFSH